MSKKYQEDVSTSCISTEPTMQAEVSSSTPRPFEKKLYETEADETALRASLIKLCAMLVFMTSSLLVICAPTVSLPSASLNKLYGALDGARARVRILQILWPLFDVQTIDKNRLGLASAAALVLAAGIYFASRKKQRPENTAAAINTVATEENCVAEVQAEMPWKNDDVVKQVVMCRCPVSNPLEENTVATGGKYVEEVQAEMPWKNVDVVKPLEENPANWKPVSGLEVKLELEYSLQEISAYERKISPDLTARRPERRARRKSISAITHNAVITRDSSVGSSQSCEKSGYKKGEEALAPLRRSSRIRNQALSPPSGGRVLISSRG